MRFYYITNIFDLHTSGKETTALLKFFWNLHGMHFVSFFFSKWRKYYNLTFDETFKIYCCYPNSSSIKKLYLRAVKSAISFFSISYICSFYQGFCQKLCEKINIFEYRFPKFISRFSILQNIKISNLVILNWWPFEYKR